MADAELTLKVGDVEVRARGAQEWVSEQREFFKEYLIADRSKRAEPAPDHVSNPGESRMVEGASGQPFDRWAKQHGITEEQLDQLFFRDKDGLKLIDTLGDAEKDRTLNTYLLMGVSALSRAGDTIVDDGEAREICKRLGCYDPKHHMERLAEAGNRLTGGKQPGWRVTTPGMTAVATLIKQVQI